MRKDCIHFTTITTRYNEIDQQGIVHNSVYGIYSEFTLEDFFRSRGFTTTQLVNELDSEICHRKNTIDYMGSVMADDIIEVGMYILKSSERSFTVMFEVYRKGEEEILVTLESVFVGYDAANRVSRPLSPTLREILELDK